jgi:hypothetical protein
LVCGGEGAGLTAMAVAGRNSIVVSEIVVIIVLSLLVSMATAWSTRLLTCSPPAIG